jgi:hypothetical protein
MAYLRPATYALPFSEPTTSRDAAVAAQSFFVSQQQRVLDWFRSRGAYGGTMGECEAALLMKRQSICARVDELRKAKQLIDTTEIRNRCRVHLAVDAPEGV